MKFDVFLSFRGIDTRRSFVSHLSHSLFKKRFRTFKHEEDLAVDQPAYPHVLEAIEESKVAIVIISKNYTSSLSCLDELAKIIECKEKGSLVLVPVFYEVDSSDFERQAENLGERDNVRNWKDAFIKMSNRFQNYASGVQEDSDSDMIDKVMDYISPHLTETTASESSTTLDSGSLRTPMTSLGNVFENVRDVLRMMSQTDVDDESIEIVEQSAVLNMLSRRRSQTVDDDDNIVEQSAVLNMLSRRRSQTVDDDDNISRRRVNVRSSVDDHMSIPTRRRSQIVDNDNISRRHLSSNTTSPVTRHLNSNTISPVRRHLNSNTTSPVRRHLSSNTTSHVRSSVENISSRVPVTSSSVRLTSPGSSVYGEKYKELSQLVPSTDFDSLLGMDRHMSSMYTLLELESRSVLEIGIYGEVGVGKTTLSKYVYNEVSPKFQDHYYHNFLNDTTNYSIGPTSTCLLEVLMRAPSTPLSRYQDVVEAKLGHRKVLLIVNGVDHIDQLKYVSQIARWFGPGSRLIIVTQHKNLLLQCGVSLLYEVESLKYDEALQLFSQFAFKQKYIPKGFDQLCVRALMISGRLPLALKVFGSFLCGKNINEWEFELLRLEASQGNCMAAVSSYIGEDFYACPTEMNMEEEDERYEFPTYCFA